MVMLAQKNPIVLPAVIGPIDARYVYSDYALLDKAEGRMYRPQVSSYQYGMPGGRVKFKTNSQGFNIKLRYNALSASPNMSTSTGVILVDGAVSTTFAPAAIPVVAQDVVVPMAFGSSVDRTIEIVMPYSSSVDFKGVTLTAGGTLTAPSAAPTTVLGLIGDSITQGFENTRVDKTWAQLLRTAKNWQVINLGIGGRVCNPVDGTALASLVINKAMYMIGVNDCLQGVSGAAFKANYKQTIANFRTLYPTTKLYCVTPTYSSRVTAADLPTYRQLIRDALNELADPNLVLVEGLTLIPNNDTYFQDQLHPNDLGAVQMATNLASIIV